MTIAIRKCSLCEKSIPACTGFRWVIRNQGGIDKQFYEMCEKCTKTIKDAIKSPPFDIA